MQGAQQAEEQCPMAEGCQVQKRVKALLRQLKAVEREQRRHRETARAQRRHVKQRHVSRAHERTPKSILHRYEEELDGDSEFLRERRGAGWGRVRRYPFERIDGQGWKIVATYRIKNHRPIYDDDYDPYDRWASSRFLAYNVYRRVVLLSEYLSGGPACPTCGFGGVDSEDAMIDILEQPYAAPMGKAFLASAEEFLECAQRLVDPAMKLRRAMPEDMGYHSLVTLYAMYTLFYSRVLRRPPLSHRREHVEFAQIAAWSPREWDLHRYNALVRLQAAWRGWHFRQRVLYSPHTELGRRYLLRDWRRECSSPI
ncbi:g2068 [Coccomyxa elongata]